jgi:uncharacterized phage protein (predicted DNA packaging)
MLDQVKLALRVSTDYFDPEISGLIEAAKLDLQAGGVTEPAAGWETDPLTVRAIITYCKAHFGEAEQYDRLKAAYDEQKAQMGMREGYTVWTAAT